MANSRNIIVGAASLFVGDADATLPEPVDGESFRRTLAGDATADPVVPPATGWTDVGYTQDGLEVSTDPSYTDVEVDQLLDAAVIFKDGMGLSVGTTLAEATLENLIIAYGQQDESLEETVGERTLTLEGGALGDAPLERQLVAVGNGPREDTGNKYRERVYHLYRVLSVEGSSHSLARADATTIPVTFRALPNNDGDYGIVRDRSLV